MKSLITVLRLAVLLRQISRSLASLVQIEQEKLELLRLNSPKQIYRPAKAVHFDKVDIAAANKKYREELEGLSDE